MRTKVEMQNALKEKVRTICPNVSENVFQFDKDRNAASKWIKSESLPFVIRESKSNKDAFVLGFYQSEKYEEWLISATEEQESFLFSILHNEKDFIFQDYFEKLLKKCMEQSIKEALKAKVRTICPNVSENVFQFDKDHNAVRKLIKSESLPFVIRESKSNKDAFVLGFYQSEKYEEWLINTEKKQESICFKIYDLDNDCHIQDYFEKHIKECIATHEKKTNPQNSVAASENKTTTPKPVAASENKTTRESVAVDIKNKIEDLNSEAPGCFSFFNIGPSATRKAVLLQEVFDSLEQKANEDSKQYTQRVLTVIQKNYKELNQARGLPTFFTGMRTDSAFLLDELQETFKIN